MIALTVKSNAKKVRRDLEKIKNRDIHAASASAWKRAAETVVSKTATAISRKARVQKWMVIGVGGAKKSKSGRIGKTLVRGPRTVHSSRRGMGGGVVIGATFYLRSGHINPAGTAKKQSRVSVLKGGKNKGSVKAQGRYYKGAFVKPGRWATPAIMTRDGNGGLTMAKIELGKPYERILKGIATKTGPRVFEKRFKHELERRLRRYGK